MFYVQRHTTSIRDECEMHGKKQHENKHEENMNRPKRAQGKPNATGNTKGHNTEFSKNQTTQGTWGRRKLNEKTKSPKT